MILVDTSIWSDHLRRGDATLTHELQAGNVLAHPFVVGEIACGLFPRRAETLALLDALPSTPVASHGEALAFIERHGLAGTGIGYIDAHLLAATLLATAILWTRDRRLAEAATRLGIAR